MSHNNTERKKKREIGLSAIHVHLLTSLIHFFEKGDHEVYPFRDVYSNDEA